ncbi:MAG: hypothetical protein IT434_07975 [Phycisphaerales bacterium]|jgi:hypothetical protein|nr:hypothetical protein [Phycisphaerales bacterium]
MPRNSKTNGKRASARTSTRAARADIKPEYDFSKATRGKYAKRLRDTVMVVLDPDVARVFRSSQEVNNALRAEASRRGRKPSSRRRTTP